ncbi:MAG: MFS transporter [Chloroflexota bacterium]
MLEPVPPAEPVPGALWRNRDYLLLLAGQSISVTGSAASGIAFPLLVLYLTGSPFQAGLVGALDTVPFLILGLPAGALVDWWNRKLVMIVCDSARAVALASIPVALWTGHLSISLIYVVVLVEGTGFAFFNVASVAALPRVVERAQLNRASANNQVMWSAGSLAGPTIGGALFGLTRALPFLADAVSYAASVLSLLFIRRRFEGERTSQDRHLVADVKEGVAWLWRHPLIRFFALVGGAQGLAIGGAQLAVIVLARNDFHASSAVIGALLGVAAAGGIVGALFSAWLQHRITLPQAVLFGLWSSALVFPLMALGPNLVVVALGAALLYLTDPIWDVAQFSYRMSRIPDALQGRVNSIYRMILWAGVPLGRLGAGAAVQAFGPRAALGAMAVIGGVIALAATFNGELRHAQR